MTSARSELHQSVVDALLESKAIDLEAAAAVLGRFAKEAATTGTPIGFVVGHRVWDVCIPPYYFGPQVVQAQRAE